MRSSNAGSDEIAAAFATLSGPEFSPGRLTSNPNGIVQGSMGCDNSERVAGLESGGMHIGSIPLRMLFCTSMPSDTAVERTYGLNEEPTCSRFSVAMLSWQKILAQFFAL